MTRLTEQAGRFLFRWRPVTGFIGFALVVLTGQGTVLSCLAGLSLILAGLGLRFWAMGYIGEDARAGEIGGERYVRDGPYRWFRLNSKSLAGHPLYAGNFLLVLGMLAAFGPAVLAGVLVVAAFLLEYYLMARTEEKFLIRKYGAAPTGRTVFELRRTLGEWRTVAVAAVCWGLALAKALLR